MCRHLRLASPGRRRRNVFSTLRLALCAAGCLPLCTFYGCGRSEYHPSTPSRAAQDAKPSPAGDEATGALPRSTGASGAPKGQPPSKLARRPSNQPVMPGAPAVPGIEDGELDDGNDKASARAAREAAEALLKAGGPTPSAGYLLAARTSIAQGRDNWAAPLLAAAAIAGSEEALGSLRWSPSLQRPMFALRWGLATVVLPAAKPGEAPTAAPAAKPGNIFSGAAGGAAPPPQPAAQAETSARRAGKRRPGESPPAEKKALDFSLPDPIAFWRQFVGVPLREAMQAGVRQGDFSVLLKDSDEKLTKAMMRSPSSGSLARFALLEASSTADVREAAQRENLDFVLVATLSTKAIRNGPTQSVLAIRVMDMSKDGDGWGPKPVNHVQVMVAQQAPGKEEEPAAALIRTVLTYIGRQYRLVEMPEFSHEAAQQRAAALSLSRPANPLSAILELRYYQWKKLLTDQEFAERAAEIAGAEDGQRLATGTEVERKQVVDRWIRAIR